MFGLRTRSRSDAVPPAAGAAEAQPYPSEVGATHDHEMHVSGQVCARCDRAIGDNDEVRRSAAGGWVHTSC